MGEDILHGLGLVGPQHPVIEDRDMQVARCKDRCAIDLGGLVLQAEFNLSPLLQNLRECLSSGCVLGHEDTAHGGIVPLADGDQRPALPDGFDPTLDADCLQLAIDEADRFGELNESRRLRVGPLPLPTRLQQTRDAQHQRVPGQPLGINNPNLQHQPLRQRLHEQRINLEWLRSRQRSDAGQKPDAEE